MERTTIPVSLLEIMLAVVVVVGLCALGCATPNPIRTGTPNLFPSARLATPPAAMRHAPGGARRPQPGDEGASFVERELHDAGLRFGTDGSTRALWGYMRVSHEIVAPADARPGDVLFFDTRGRQGQDPACADHAGLVERVDSDGRITFVEARGGQIRESYVDPTWPLIRRDDRGQILNSFLRAKKISDPAGTRYFAGEMLCAVARPRLD